MEIEIKLRLKGAGAHAKLLATLDGAGFDRLAKHRQENFFFDGTEGELSSNRVILRIRFYNVDEKALVTVKGKTVIREGVGKSSEVEEYVDPGLARMLVENPKQIIHQDIQVIQDTCRQFGVKDLRGLGGFKNVRDVFKWKGVELEVDETHFDWGTVHELECETTEPDKVKVELERFLSESGIEYGDSKVTKFQNFVNQTLE